MSGLEAGFGGGSKRAPLSLMTPATTAPRTASREETATVAVNGSSRTAEETGEP